MNTRIITANGITDSISGWARRLGCTRQNLSNNLANDADVVTRIENHMSTPARRNGDTGRPSVLTTVNGTTATRAEWAARLKISERTLRYWMIETNRPLADVIHDTLAGKKPKLKRPGRPRKGACT